MAQAHLHPHSTATLRDLQRRALQFALVLNGGYLLVEIAGALIFNSLALLADAAHMLSDVVGLGIALAAQRLAMRPATARHTYGFQRAEVLGALANAVVIGAATTWIVFEAIGRLRDPQSVEGGGLLLVAAAGLIVNAWSALVIRRSQGTSLNMRGAFVHMWADALGSIGVIVAAIGVLAWDATWLDPAASLAIAAIVIWSAWGLLRATLQVLLEGAPSHLRSEEIENALADESGVESVHHLHLWSLASDVPALSAHVVLGGEPTLHDAQNKGDEIKLMLEERFGISHATLELECHDCED
jgi:cobalt-zinc-cadmium efflux system protein